MALNVNKLKLAEHARNLFSVSLEPAEKFEDLLDPAYWAHIAAKLRVHDRVEVVAADGTWFAELIVSATANTWAKMSVLRFVELEPCKMPDAAVKAAKEQKQSTPNREAAFYREWDAKAQAHRIVRRADKEVVAAGIKDRAEADAKVDLLIAEATV